jgi:predicted DsbA family dithiol-disulfide isomerase
VSSMSAALALPTVRPLPSLPSPWKLPGTVASEVRVGVTHVTDPLCPWAYSFEPALRTLEARFGAQLEFRTVLIGLVESVEQSLGRGSSAQGRALSALRFRRYGMPITPHIRERVIASGPACRLVIAAGQQSADLADAILRLLRLAWYTTDLLLDTDDALRDLCEHVSGLDVNQAMTDLHSQEVEAIYQQQRQEARTPAEIAITMGRTANSDGAERHTAPTLIFTTDDGRSSVVPGFQPYEAAEVALLNLEPRLVRRRVPSLERLLAEYPGGLTSQEVARVAADTTSPVDRLATETELTRLVADGKALRLPLGDDALWRLA